MIYLPQYATLVVTAARVEWLIIGVTDDNLLSIFHRQGEVRLISEVYNLLVNSVFDKNGFRARIVYREQTRLHLVQY